MKNQKLNKQKDIFGNTYEYQPLAERMRPSYLKDFIGQTHITGKGKPIRLMVDKGEIVSMILWGPPGTGKTTLALILSNELHYDFIQISAVSAGVKDVREAVETGEKNLKYYNKRTILFIDEIHRFNKAQQDSLLGSVEKGTLILIGATTENPSFEVISPLLSRCRVYVLEELKRDELLTILKNALKNDIFLKKEKININDFDFLIYLSAGDARKLLNGLELSIKISTPAKDGTYNLTNEIFKEAFQAKQIKYDKNREEHYNIISAFIKSIRGSDPDAAVYWLARMLKGGEDPKFIARRMIVLASEDIGNADPYAITLATSAFTAVDYIGMPEARIVLSQTAIYLASAQKSNASYMAIEKASIDVENLPDFDVPLHLRNAPTKLMKELGYSQNYKYAHDFDKNFVEQQYLPDNIKDKIYYFPTVNGAEERLRKRLNEIWKKKR